MPEIDPITREEKLWSGEDIEPITREEMYIKHIFDKTQPIPSKPITRKEMLLEKAGEGGGSDVTIKQLSVTANGTYSEEGTAYSPVIVNVPAPPIPDNAYLLNEVEGLPSDIASFSDGSNLPMPKLQVGIEPIQEGSGDPSPENVRPISGFTEANVVVSPLNISQLYNGQIYGDGTWIDNSARLTNVQTAQSNVYFLKAGTYTLDFDKLNPNAPNLIECSLLTKDSNFNIVDNFADAWNSLPFTFTLTQDGYLYFTMRKDYGTTLNVGDYKAKILGQTYTVEFKDGSNPLTVYGGSLDVVSGELTVDRIYKQVKDFEWRTQSGYYGKFFTVPTGADKALYDANKTLIISDTYKGYSDAGKPANTNGSYIGSGGAIKIWDSEYTEETDVDAWKTARANVELCYYLATPITYQLTPTQVKSLLGSNNVWANTGKIEELEYFSKEVALWIGRGN